MRKKKKNNKIKEIWPKYRNAVYKWVKHYKISRGNPFVPIFSAPPPFPLSHFLIQPSKPLLGNVSLIYGYHFRLKPTKFTNFIRYKIT